MVFHIPCLKASYLTEKSLVSPLTYFEKMKLNIHIRHCKVCRTYEQHSRLLDKALKKLSDPMFQNQVKLPAEIRQNIMNSI